MYITFIFVFFKTLVYKTLIFYTYSGYCRCSNVVNIDISIDTTLSIYYCESAFSIAIFGCTIFTIFIILVIPVWMLSLSNHVINYIKWATSKKLNSHFLDLMECHMSEGTYII